MTLKWPSRKAPPWCASARPCSRACRLDDAAANFQSGALPEAREPGFAFRRRLGGPEGETLQDRHAVGAAHAVRHGGAGPAGDELIRLGHLDRAAVDRVAVRPQ